MPYINIKKIQCWKWCYSII